jgi:hypothetical protein
MKITTLIERLLYSFLRDTHFPAELRACILPDWARGRLVKRLMELVGDKILKSRGRHDSQSDGRESLTLAQAELLNHDLGFESYAGSESKRRYGK